MNQNESPAGDAHLVEDVEGHELPVATPEDDVEGHVQPRRDLDIER